MAERIGPIPRPDDWADGYRAGVERAAERVEILSGNPACSAETSETLRLVAESIRKIAPPMRRRRG